MAMQSPPQTLNSLSTEHTLVATPLLLPPQIASVAEGEVQESQRGLVLALPTRCPCTGARPTPGVL